MGDTGLGLVSSYRSIVEEIYESTRQSGRLLGSPGDRWVEEYLRGRLEDLGLEVHVESYEARGWLPRAWSLEVHDGERWVPVPSYFMARTRPGLVEARLYWAGDLHSEYVGEEARGRVAAGSLVFPSLDLGILLPAALQVSDPAGDLRAGGGEKPSVFMTRLHPSECGCPVDPEAYEASARAGAVGFVGVLENYPDMGCGEFSYYAPSDGVFRELPGVWVPREWGRRLGEWARAGRPVRLELDAWQGSVEGRNIYAVLPGRGDEIVVVHSHHDAPFGGAVQDASGVAMVLKLAEYFAGLGDSPRRTLVFLFTEGHFDAGSGQEAFLDAHPEWADRIVADVAIEHIAREYVVEDGRIVESGRPEPRALFVSEESREIVDSFTRALLAYAPRATLLLPTNTILGVPSDANRFWRRGVPVASLISGPVYMFSSCDTPEKVDYDSVEPLYNMFVAAIRSLAY